MEKIDIVKRDNLGVIIIKNPPHNSLSMAVFMGLKQGLEELKNDEAIKIIVITGQGLFSAGADVVEINQAAQKGNKDEIKEMVETAHDILSSIENLGKPVVAAIDGYCLGGGNELAMACTARVASDQAKFGQPEIRLGIIPGFGGTQRLPRLIGIKRALEMTVVGNFISAGDAQQLGLIDLVVPQKDLIAKTKEFAARILTNPVERKKPGLNPEEVDTIAAEENFRNLVKTKSQEAVKAVLKAYKEGCALPLAEALKLEVEIITELVVSPDSKEGVSAFLEKRKPDFPSLAKPGEKKEKTEAKAETPPPGDAPSQSELDLIRDTARDFARKEIGPNIEQMEKDQRILPGIIKKMGELGFFGIAFPEKYGGTGLGKTAYCVCAEELMRVHASTGAFVGVHVGLCGNSINLSGTEAQKQKYLVPLIEGKKIGAFALTEPEAGSDAANVQTSVKKEGGKWILNGTKQFITNGDIADIIVVIAQTDKFLGTQGLTAFIVETKWPGFSVIKKEEKIGTRAAPAASLAFDNMEVPDENLLGGVGEGFKIFMNTLNSGRLGLAAGCLGMAKEAFKLAFAHASERVQFGKTLLEQEVIQFYFAEMRANIYLMESALYRAAKDADSGKDYRLEAAILKQTCSEMSSDIIDRSLQIFGGYGYCEDYPIARMYRDSRINRIWEGTTEIQKLMIIKETFKSGGVL